MRRPCALILLCILGTLASAQERVTERLDDAFSILREAMDGGEIPGAVALVGQRGKVLRQEAFGLCDLEQQRPFSPDALCWIASITKPVTVAAALKLVEQEKLRLDDVVEDYLP